ncbi:MAG TPA: acyltransferase, partial [candidate division Zixibacteria bacterium]|nr:acyltransferase [candidate division Zixibacteria bacterium]
CNVQAGVTIGADCNVCDHCFVERGAVIGDRVTIKNGVAVWEGVVLEDDVFVGPNAVFTNDVYPRSKVYHAEVARTLVQRGATIGANAVIVAGHTIGQWAMIGAGAVLTKDAPDFTLWYGNPARLIGYVCRCAQRLEVGPDPDAIRCACGLVYRREGERLVCAS